MLSNPAKKLTVVATAIGAFITSVAVYSADHTKGTAKLANTCISHRNPKFCMHPPKITILQSKPANYVTAIPIRKK